MERLRTLGKSCRIRTLTSRQRDGEIKAARRSNHKPLAWLGFGRAGRSGRVPRLVLLRRNSIVFSALLPIPRPRWTQPREVKAAGLVGADGVVLGRLGHDNLRHDGPEHVLCFAPTLSSKGGRPSSGWKPSRHAIHSVAPQIVSNTIRKLLMP